MADSKLTALSAFTPITTDLLYGVDDPGGTPVSGKILISALATLLHASATLTGLTTMTVGAANTGVLVSTGYSLTGSDATSMMSLTGTLNTSGTVDVLQLNITNTASNAASNLFNFKVGGSTVAQIDIAGRVRTNNVRGLSDPWAIRAANDAQVISISSTALALNAPVTIWNGNYLRFSSDAGSANALYLTRKAAASLMLGDTDAASPVAQTLRVQSVVAGTSDTAGANWTLAGSVGTGTGAGGDIIFQTAPAGTTGTAQNALATALTIKGSGKVITKVSATAAAGFNIPDGTAPTSPVTGDLWAESGVLKYYDGSTTKSLAFV